jgi:hypothetical protein
MTPLFKQWSSLGLHRDKSHLSSARGSRRHIGQDVQLGLIKARKITDWHVLAPDDAAASFFRGFRDWFLRNVTPISMVNPGVTARAAAELGP